MALNNSKSLLPRPISSLGCPASLASLPSILPSPLPLPPVPLHLPPVEAESLADGHASTMAVASMNKPSSRKCSCLPPLSSLFPRITLSKSEKDAQRSKTLIRKPVPDRSNESSPSRPPHDVALPMTPVENGPLPPLPQLPLPPIPSHLDKPSLPPTPVDEIPLPQIPLPPIPTSEPVAIPTSKRWSTLRKSRSSTQLPSLARSLSPSIRNSSPQSRVVSVPVQPRPDSYHSSSESFDPMRKRRSWMPGSKPGSRHTSQDYTSQMGPLAWVATEPTALDYTSSLNFLKIGTKVTIST